MTITCNAGFKASGTATLNCVNGKYDAAVPQCVGKHRSISLYKPSPTSNSNVSLQLCMRLVLHLIYIFSMLVLEID